VAAAAPSRPSRSLLARLLGGTERSPFADRAGRDTALRFGMALFLITLAVIFAATLLAYVIVRLSPVNADSWRPAGAGSLPTMLAISTAALLASSGTIHLALVAARRGERSVAGWVAATFALGLLFLTLQIVGWGQATAANIRFDQSLYAWTFYVLTGLHALHLLAAFPPLAVVLVRASRGAYGPDATGGLVLCAMYWHFLDAVWIILYATLLWGSGR
jgi:cytochrome c oxidase subunit 3